MMTEGRPFKGLLLEMLKEFLEKQGLRYDTGIEYSVCMTDASGSIIGTGSVEENVIKCVAVKPEFQGRGIAGQIVSALISYEFEKGCSHIFIYTKPANEELFSDMGFYRILKTKEILFMENWKDGIRRFAEQLKRETWSDAMRGGVRIGAVVANCNPFTRGHHYLLENAVKKCDYLHLFILDDSRSCFSPDERYRMALESCRDLEKVMVHRGSEYIVSAATFPDYFFKDRGNAAEANCRLDLDLFAERIAPELHIQIRFVGSEPSCRVTGAYNCMMKKILPSYGILVEEIERLKLHGKVVSASDVRTYISDGKIGEVRELVQESTWPYVEQKIKGNAWHGNRGR